MRRWAPKHAHCSAQRSPWRDANQHAQCTVGPQIRASRLVSRRDVCTLRSFADSLVESNSNRRLTTLLPKHRIYSLNVINTTGWKKHNVWTMNTQIISTLQVFLSFSHNCKSHFLQCCPKKLIRFLCESIRNLLKGNLRRKKRHHVTKFQSNVRLLPLRKIPWKQRRDVLAFGKGLWLQDVNTLPVLNQMF